MQSPVLVKDCENPLPETVTVRLPFSSTGTSSELEPLAATVTAWLKLGFEPVAGELTVKAKELPPEALVLARPTRMTAAVPTHAAFADAPGTAGGGGGVVIGVGVGAGGFGGFEPPQSPLSLRTAYAPLCQR